MHERCGQVSRSAVYSNCLQLLLLSSACHSCQGTCLKQAKRECPGCEARNAFRKAAHRSCCACSNSFLEALVLAAAACNRCLVLVTDSEQLTVMPRCQPRCLGMADGGYNRHLLADKGRQVQGTVKPNILSARMPTSGQLTVMPPCQPRCLGWLMGLQQAPLGRQGQARTGYREAKHSLSQDAHKGCSTGCYSPLKTPVKGIDHVPQVWRHNLGKNGVVACRRRPRLHHAQREQHVAV